MNTLDTLFSNNYQHIIRSYIDHVNKIFPTEDSLLGKIMEEFVEYTNEYHKLFEYAEIQDFDYLTIKSKYLNMDFDQLWDNLKHQIDKFIDEFSDLLSLYHVYSITYKTDFNIKHRDPDNILFRIKILISKVVYRYNRSLFNGHAAYMRDSNGYTLFNDNQIYTWFLLQHCSKVFNRHSMINSILFIGTKD